MKNLIAFFEIPSADFYRAVDFYETVLGLKLPVCECEEESMAFFMEQDETIGAISYASNFRPSENGVLIHFNCEDMEESLKIVCRKGGKILIPKTKIEAEGKGYFSVFADCEGNRIGFYSDK